MDPRNANACCHRRHKNAETEAYRVVKKSVVRQGEANAAIDAATGTLMQRLVGTA
jgi:hypothetical protein